MFMNNTVSHNSYLFTIEESSKVAVISTIVPVKSEQDYQRKYMYSEIYWDITCVKPLMPNHRLLFVDDKNQACKEMMKSNLSSINVADNVNLRSSSPNQHYIPKAKILELHSGVKRLGVLFTSDKELTTKSVGQYLSCSDSDQIHITNKTKTIQGDMNTVKAMDKDGSIQEKMVVHINDVEYTTIIKCMHIPSKTKLFSEHIEVRSNRLNNSNREKINICCLNNTHSIETFGVCTTHRTFVEKKDDDVQYIEQGNCNDQNVQMFVKFIQFETCIMKFSYMSLCSDVSVLGPCFGSSCS